MVTGHVLAASGRVLNATVGRNNRGDRVMKQSGTRILKGMRLAALAALGATVFAVAPAWATPVSSWSYTVTSTFDTANTSFSNGCGNTHPASNSATTGEIIWGCASNRQGNRSSLVITGSPATDPPPLLTDDVNPMALGITLTHNNFVISGSHLTTTILHNAFSLTGNDGTTAIFDLSFGINFTETSNSGKLKNCAAPSTTPCADIFVISDKSLNYKFTANGYDYFASIFPLAGIDNLDKTECHAAGVAANSCSGFWTQENKSTPLDFAMRITSTPIGGTIPVPEPGALGLMGLGLLSIVGLAALRRRRSTEDTLA